MNGKMDIWMTPIVNPDLDKEKNNFFCRVQTYHLMIRLMAIIRVHIERILNAKILFVMILLTK
jgi:hypothetical protein